MFGFTSILPDEEDECCTSGLLNCQNPNQNSTIDSGYFSPQKRPYKQLPKIPDHNNSLLSEVNTNSISPMKSAFMQSPLKNSAYDYTSTGLTDKDFEWEIEKDFFTNFEENLFSLDLDDQTLDDILKSPKGKEAMKDLMNSPKGKAIINSPKGKFLKDRIKRTTGNSMPQQTCVTPSWGGQSLTDSRKVGVTPMKQDSQKALKMSKRKLSMVSPTTRVQQSAPVVYTQHIINQNVSIQPKLSKENTMPALWPTQEKLKFARSQFKLTLEKAIKSVQSVPQKPETKRQKGKSDKYPQLSKALSRPKVSNETVDGDSPSSVRKSERKMQAGSLIANCRLEDDWYRYSDDDNDEDWKGDLPFTGLKQATKRRKTKGSNSNNKRRKVVKNC